MPDREETYILVRLELDPVPGTFHTRSDAQYQVEQILKNAIPHYNPTVVRS